MRVAIVRMSVAAVARTGSWSGETPCSLAAAGAERVAGRVRDTRRRLSASTSRMAAITFGLGGNGFSFVFSFTIAVGRARLLARRVPVHPADRLADKVQRHGRECSVAAGDCRTRNRTSAAGRGEARTRDVRPPACADHHRTACTAAGAAVRVSPHQNLSREPNGGLESARLSPMESVRFPPRNGAGAESDLLRRADAEPRDQDIKSRLVNAVVDGPRLAPRDNACHVS